MGVEPGADRAFVRVKLGEPDERGDDDRVWRYGDLRLRLDADTLREFFGEIAPDELLEGLAAGDRAGVWTQDLQSGAELTFEREHAGSCVRLCGFSITS